jgi:hypothetical protein
MTDQLDNVNDKPDNGQPPVDKALEFQAKIDAAVKSRVAREKEHQKELEATWLEEKKALEEENTFLKAQFQAKIDEQLADLPASFRSLVSKLPIRDQIKWLEENAEEQKAKPKAPAMPNFDKKQTEGKGEIKHIQPDRIA